MYKCTICNKTFDKRHSYIGHCSSHHRSENYKKNRKGIIHKDKKIKTATKTTKTIKIHICIYCKKEFEKGTKLGGHVGRCKLNPKYHTTIQKISKSQKGRKHTQETKEKISKIRIKYLTENPDKVPYKINHSSNMSYPEKIFANALNSNGITGWIYNYRNNIYAYDFAFPDIKLDVEIDGATHLTEKVKKIDQRRDEFNKNNGWKILRFTAKQVKENIFDCIEHLKKHFVSVAQMD